MSLFPELNSPTFMLDLSMHLFKIQNKPRMLEEGEASLKHPPYGGGAAAQTGRSEALVFFFLSSPAFRWTLQDASS